MHALNADNHISFPVLFLPFLVFEKFHMIVMF